jgi:hypothetical protein
MEAVVKRRIPSLRRESNPRTPIIQPVAQSPILKYSLAVFPKRLRNRIADLLSDIRTEGLPNLKQQCYPLHCGVQQEFENDEGAMKYNKEENINMRKHQ